MRAWLAVVAKHVGFDECMKDTVESLSQGFQLAYFGCTKCGVMHLDSGNFENVSSILATYARFVATGGSNHHL